MKDLKTERVPIMFDKQLLRDVDEFSFESRIRTRAAAVRTLIQAGLDAKQREKGSEVSA